MALDTNYYPAPALLLNCINLGVTLENFSGDKKVLPTRTASVV